jgi:S1-C subfamily serine protease
MIRGSRAARAGLRPGAVVAQVDGQPVATEQEFFLIASRSLAQGRTVRVTVTDDSGQDREVEIDPRP